MIRAPQTERRAGMRRSEVGARGELGGAASRPKALGWTGVAASEGEAGSDTTLEGGAREGRKGGESERGAGRTFLPQPGPRPFVACAGLPPAL